MHAGLAPSAEVNCFHCVQWKGDAQVVDELAEELGAP
jgi:hypothetical protein